jgi:hypothetical protein
LKVLRAEDAVEGMLVRGFVEDITDTTGGASRMVCVINGVEG